jgi:pyruvate/2-oxoglutarate dehydrogenase complex dihydrolipoamide acyltransferase (E2) component
MADTELRLPKIGMAMTEATVAEWLVDDGAVVEEGQEVATIETDKVDTDIEAPAAGTIRILVQAGETVDVGAVLAVLS